MKRASTTWQNGLPVGIGVLDEGQGKARVSERVTPGHIDEKSQRVSPAL